MHVNMYINDYEIVRIDIRSWEKSSTRVYHLSIYNCINSFHQNGPKLNGNRHGCVNFTITFFHHFEVNMNLNTHVFESIWTLLANTKIKYSKI